MSLLLSLSFSLSLFLFLSFALSLTCSPSFSWSLSLCSYLSLSDTYIHSVFEWREEWEIGHRRGVGMQDWWSYSIKTLNFGYLENDILIEPRINSHGLVELVAQASGSSVRLPHLFTTSYRVVPGHRNWQIETAVWNLAGFLHFTLETRWQRFWQFLNDFFDDFLNDFLYENLNFLCENIDFLYENLRFSLWKILIIFPIIFLMIHKIFYSLKSLKFCKKFGLSLLLPLFVIVFKFQLSRPNPNFWNAPAKIAPKSPPWIDFQIWVEPDQSSFRLLSWSAWLVAKLKKIWKNGAFGELSVWTRAGFVWRAAAPGLPSACRTPQR